MVLQKIGASLLVVAWILFLLAETGYSYIMLVVTGVISFYLWTQSRTTVSQWIQRLTYNKLIDYGVLIALLISTFWIFFSRVGVDAAFVACLPLLLIWLALHFFVA